MDPEGTNESNAVNMIQCRFHHYGCTESFPRNELSRHWCSQKHVQTLINIIISLHVKHDDALIDLMMNPCGVDELPSRSAIAASNCEQLFGKLTNITMETLQETTLASVTTNGSSNFDRIYGQTESPVRALIERTDRNPDPEHNAESHQAELQLSESKMDDLSNLIAALSTAGTANHQREQTPDPTLASAQQSMTQSPTCLCAYLRNELDSKPDSTDGCLLWHIDKIFEKIGDATCGKKLYIDSRLFQTSMCGRRFWARLYLNGNTDRRFISLHIHRNFPANDNFHGTVKFVLVDQSSNEPLQHIVRPCSGPISSVGDRLGFENFIDKNLIHKEGNRYILNDSIYVIVYIPQTTEQKFSNLPENVRDALMTISQ